MKHFWLLLCLLRAGTICHAQDNGDDWVKRGVLKHSHAKKLTLDHEKAYFFGQSGFFTGHFQLLADQIRRGIITRFMRVNSSGGINGKSVHLISIEDRGRPNLLKKNIALMHDQLGIQAFIGVMGTHGITNILPDMMEKHYALLFPWGGSVSMRDPSLTMLVNGIGYIKPQIERLVDYAANRLQLKKIALFFADSSFGRTNEALARQALKRYGIEPAASVPYSRLTMDIKKSAALIAESDPHAVICLSTSTPASKLISEMFELGHYGTRFMGIDSTLFVGDILKLKGSRFAYTSVIPDPEESDMPLATEYLKDMKKYFPDHEPNPLGFAYYAHAAIALKALSDAGGSLDAPTLVRAIERMVNTDLDGFPLNFSPTTRHVYPHDVTLVKG